METKISHSKKVTLMPLEFVEGCMQFFRDERKASPNDINAMLVPQYVDYDYEEGTVTLKYETREWEMNRVGILHGGATTAMLDHATGCAIYAFVGHWCPSVDMDVRFISQAVMGDVLTCVGRVIHCGERFVTAEAVITNDKNGRLVATYMTTCANGAERAKGALDKGIAQK